MTRPPWMENSEPRLSPIYLLSTRSLAVKPSASQWMRTMPVPRSQELLLTRQLKPILTARIPSMVATCPAPDTHPKKANSHQVWLAATMACSIPISESLIPTNLLANQTLAVMRVICPTNLIRTGFKTPTALSLRAVGRTAII